MVLSTVRLINVSYMYVYTDDKPTISRACKKYIFHSADVKSFL